MDRGDLGWVSGLLLAGLVISAGILSVRLSSLSLPGYDRGYQPAQPIAFSHRLHSGELRVACVYCHPAAARARYAGTPASGLCMNCHRFVSATLGAVRAEEAAARAGEREPVRVISTEIRKIYESLGLDDELQPVGTGSAVAWVRIHKLPDFVFFHHGAHQAAGIDCAECHGAVETMEKVRQTASLSMGWCVNCHRDYQGRSFENRRLVASVDCGVCHL